MYFNVYSDTGAEIQGYLIPDGFSTTPRITVRSQAQDFGPFDCNIFLEGPYKHKHHETGVVGFSLNEANVPGLQQARDIEIADADTGFVFYRRLDPERHIQKRLFRLETQFAPHRELDRSLQPHFQFYAESAEQFGSETVRQMMEIVHQPSTYVSGRVLLKSVQRYFTPETVTIASLRDPYYELAIRLWSIASFKKRRFSFVSERDAILFEPAMSYFADVNFSDGDDIGKKIKHAPAEVMGLFESPFTQQLVAASPTDKASRDSVASALDALSQFAVFCPEELDDSLGSDLCEFLSLPPGSLAFSPIRSPFRELADTLRQIKLLEQVLENDLILFFFIRQAQGRAMRGD